MPVDNCNNNLPQDFQNCDDRVFAFAPDKLPHKDKPIHAIEYARLKYILRKLKGEYFKNRPFNGFTLTEYFLERMRKYKIDGVSYIWPYEARWETNETLAEELGGFTNPLSYRQIRTAFDQAKHYGLIHNPASQGDRLRLFRLHDELIQMAKMTDSQIAEYIIRQNKHRPQKSKYIDRRSRSTSTAEVEVHRPQKSIELNKELNKELNNSVKQPASNLEQSGWQANMDKQQSEHDHDAVTRTDQNDLGASHDSHHVNNDGVYYLFDGEEPTPEQFLEAAGYNQPSDQIKEHTEKISEPESETENKRKASSFLDKLENEHGKPARKEDVIKTMQAILFAKDGHRKIKYQYLGPDFCKNLYEQVAGYFVDTERPKYKVSHVADLASLAIGHLVMGTKSRHKELFDRCLEHKDGSYFLRSYEFTELLGLIENDLDEDRKATLEPATAKALSLDQITAKRLSEMELAGNSDKFIADLNAKFFNQSKIKQLDSSKRDGVLIDLMTNDISWELIKDAWNRDQFDAVFRDSMFATLLSYSETFRAQKKKVVNRQKPMSEKDQWSHGLIAQSQKTMNRKRPTQWIIAE